MIGSFQQIKNLTENKQKDFLTCRMGSAIYKITFRSSVRVRSDDKIISSSVVEQKEKFHPD